MNKFFSLKRITSDGQFKPEIDGLRFLAIMPVLLSHAFYVYKHNVASSSFLDVPFQWFFENGGSGIYIFFVISGYILSMAFYRTANLDKKISISQYFKRRLIRLEPPYVIMLIGFSVILIMKGAYSIEVILERFLASVFYVHNVLYNEGSLINTVAWTLEVEFQFYVLAPLLLYIYRLKTFRFHALITIIIFFLLACSMMGSNYRSILSQGHFFVLGSLLHLTQPIADRLFTKFYDTIRACIFIFTVIVFFRSTSLGASFLENSYKLLILFVMFSLALSPGVVRKVLSMPHLYLIGGICYSIYLIHYPLLSFLSKQFGKLNFLDGNISFLMFVLSSTSVVLILSMLFAIFIERPFMGLNFKK